MTHSYRNPVLASPTRRFWLFSISLVAAVASAAAAIASPPSEANPAQTPDRSTESNRGADEAHTDSPTRVDELVQRAGDEEWSVHRLFSHLELDGVDECLDFSDRTRLRERHARWSEAIVILDRVDPDALDAWLLGREHPPQIVEREVKTQLHCLFEGLIGAADQDTYDIRLFPNIAGRLDGRFRSPSELARAIDSQSYWRDRAMRALRRTIFRDFGSQAYIWHRKMTFTGRSFNRISDRAAEECGLHGERFWRPASQRHRRCWRDILPPEQREREVLSASAGPGISRHHWGTDVDVLAIRPQYFEEGGVLHDDWRWLDDHGLDFGFFQTYRELDIDGYAHMEEPWHWSYYPIAQALWEFARRDPERIESLLFERWDHLDRAWSSAHGPYFDHLRQHWQDYFFNIYVPSVDARSPARESAP